MRTHALVALSLLALAACKSEPAEQAPPPEPTHKLAQEPDAAPAGGEATGDPSGLPAAMPERADFAAGDKSTPVSFGRLSMTLPGAWSISTGNGQAVMVPEEARDVGLLLGPPVSLGGKSLADALAARADALAKSATIKAREPKAPNKGKTKGGLAFAEQAFALEQSGTAYYIDAVLVDVGGGEAQLLMLLAPSIDKLKTFVKQAAPALQGATAAAAPKAASAPPKGDAGKPSGGGGSVYAQTDWDKSVSGVWLPESPKLPAIDFDFAYVARVDSTYADDIAVGRGSDGRVLMAVLYQIGSKIGGVRQLHALGSGGKWQQLELGEESIAKEIGRLAGTSVSVMMFEQLDVDLAGNVLVGVQLYGGVDFGAYLSLRKGGGLEPAVFPGYLGKAAAAVNPKGYWTTERSALTPQGNVWVVMQDLDDHTVFVHAARGADGKWMGRSFSPALTHPKLPAPEPEHIVYRGASDGDGNWVFFSNGVLWRVTPEGKAGPLALIAISEDGAHIAPPLVTATGDIWLAINTDYDVGGTVYTDTGQVKDTWFYVGDRARLVRFRPDGKGGMTAAEIDGKAVLAALTKAGAKLQFENLFEVWRLRADPVTGGLMLVETKNGLLLGLVPK